MAWIHHFMRILSGFLAIQISNQIPATIDTTNAGLNTAGVNTATVGNTATTTGSTTVGSVAAGGSTATAGGGTTAGTVSAGGNTATPGGSATAGSVPAGGNTATAGGDTIAGTVAAGGNTAGSTATAGGGTTSGSVTASGNTATAAGSITSGSVAAGGNTATTTRSTTSGSVAAGGNTATTTRSTTSGSVAAGGNTATTTRSTTSGSVAAGGNTATTTRSTTSGSVATGGNTATTTRSTTSGSVAAGGNTATTTRSTTTGGTTTTAVRGPTIGTSWVSDTSAGVSVTNTPSTFLPKGSGIFKHPECNSVDSCLECLCGVESNEGTRGCEMEHEDPTCPRGCSRRPPGGTPGLSPSEDPCYCGSYQISEMYYNKCVKGKYKLTKKGFLKCARDTNCAKQCVKNYLHKYSAKCFGKNPAKIKCIDYFRLHRGGPDDCKNLKTTPEWKRVVEERQVKKCCNTPALGCKTEEACLAFLCGAESADGAFGCGTDYGGGKCGTYKEKTLVNCNKPKRGGCKCGLYQFNRQYFKDCSSDVFPPLPKKNLDLCSVDLKCATACVRNYISLHAKACTGKSDPSQLTCEERARIHRGGPNCKKIEGAIKFARKLAKECKQAIDPAVLAAQRAGVEP